MGQRDREKGYCPTDWVLLRMVTCYPLNSNMDATVGREYDEGKLALDESAFEMSLDDISVDPETRWFKSRVKEFSSLIEMGTWTYHCKSEALPGESLMGCKWVDKVKSSGVDKSRLVGQGFLQREGFDYFESYSPTGAADSFLVFMSLSAYTGRFLKKYDAQNAYVMADLPAEEQVWMKQPPGFEVFGGQTDGLAEILISLGVKLPGKDGEELILKLRKSLYGLVAAGRIFNRFVVAWALKNGFEQLRTDECFFRLRMKNNDEITIYIYVDDVLVDSTSQGASDAYDSIWSSTFKSSAGSGAIAKSFLNMNIQRNAAERTVTITQTKMIEDIAAMFNATTGKDYETPMATDFDPTFDENEPLLDTKMYPYRRIIGALTYVVTHTRPDPAVAVNTLAKHTVKPQTKHWKAATRVLRYLVCTKELGLTYSGTMPEYMQNKIYGFHDATWASDKDTRESRAGWLTKLNGAAVKWGSKVIPTVCLSSAEAETSAAVMLVKDILSLRLLLWELGYEQPGSTHIYGDNEATLRSATGNGQSKQSKYYQMRTSFLRHYVRLGKINFNHIPGSKLIADMLTKAQETVKFKEQRLAVLGTPPLHFDD